MANTPRPVFADVSGFPEAHLTSPESPHGWSRSIWRALVNDWISVVLIVAGLTGAIALTAPPLFTPAGISTTSSPTHSVAARPKAVGLTPSVPTHLEIPDIGLVADLVQLGKNTDGSLETPSDYVHAGWYRYSPTPGEIGPAIITGHVDNYLGPAVFFYLKDLQPGQRINIQREDASVVTFLVDRVALFDQNNFPTSEVYGNIDYPGLRLITCGGIYNPLTGHYSHNIVVYASYVTNQ